ncbi:ABC transporter ATP-binding protein [Lichenicola cladoniae]|uniref:ABC transporter ATP-binding protein n=1 Tax=Lichenicola cladoniae TaxID=1484109 RepID=A0A6M8HLR0_9PROT|nr:ABC transporter ATP-binding protein [Lichenicola cladoniae]NPD68950.1 ABC transporter ATP-binding protein [Acetobacteraceae bacterium]QKE89294.1 ABC transporter ATP-binding protein [Lichenicola cladoniae]
MTDADEPVLAVRDLVTVFHTARGTFRALDGVNLTVPRGRTVALVGESGSGKSVTSMSIMRLLNRPSAEIISGQILFRGRSGRERDLVQLDERSMRSLRGNEIAMIFQEPMTSLNPTGTIGEQISEALRLHRRISRRLAAAEAVRLLGLVEISDPARRVDSYPHHLSGGMRQRVMIAMALACGPSLLLADEPTTALDVTVQAQILQLLRTLQAELGMGVLFITHNMGVVAEIADRVSVMYGGQVIESAPSQSLFDAPGHPYTRALMASLPRMDEVLAPHRRLPTIRGNVVDPRSPPPGCRFAPRCDLTLPACEAAVPEERRIDIGHQSRCLRWQELT